MRLPVILFSLIAISSMSANAAPQDYKILNTTPLQGGVRWDYLTYDDLGNRLFIARGDSIDIVDTKTMTLAGSIRDKPGLHGVALANDLGKGFISNGETASVTVFSLSDLKTTASIPAADDADAILYDKNTHRIFTANGDANSLSVIDAKENKNIASVALGGKPEFAVIDGRGKLFVNIADKSELVSVDIASLKVLSRYDLKPACTEPTGLSIDQEKERLFVGCRNQIMAVVDGHTGKILSSLPIGKSNDATKYDAVHKLAFASNGDGTMTILGEDGSDSYKVNQIVTTMPGARTMALDTKNNKAYLVSATVDHIDPPTPDHPRPRPKYKEGSFVVMTIGDANSPNK